MTTTTIGATQLQILAVLDKGPNFAAQILAEHPELVSPKPKEAKDGTTVTIVDSGAIYTKLKRLEKRELIERVKNYKPPNAKEMSRLTRTRAVWYRLTTMGREVLDAHRRSIAATKPRK